MKFKQIFQSFLLLLLTSVLAVGQTDLSVFEGMKPRSIGPAGMSGRVTSIMSFGITEISFMQGQLQVDYGSL